MSSIDPFNITYGELVAAIGRTQARLERERKAAVGDESIINLSVKELEQQLDIFQRTLIRKASSRDERDTYEFLTAAIDQTDKRLRQELILCEKAQALQKSKPFDLILPTTVAKHQAKIREYTNNMEIWRKRITSKQQQAEIEAKSRRTQTRAAPLLPAASEPVAILAGSLSRVFAQDSGVLLRLQKQRKQHLEQQQAAEALLITAQSDYNNLEQALLLTATLDQDITELSRTLNTYQQTIALCKETIKEIQNNIIECDLSVTTEKLKQLEVELKSLRVQQHELQTQKYSFECEEVIYNSDYECDLKQHKVLTAQVKNIQEQLEASTQDKIGLTAQKMAATSKIDSLQPSLEKNYTKMLDCQLKITPIAESLASIETQIASKEKERKSLMVQKNQLEAQLDEQFVPSTDLSSQ